MQKNSYISPEVWPYELHMEGVVCISQTGEGLPGQDFDDSTIIDGGLF